MENKIVNQPFRLFQDDPNISVSDGTANQWTDIWKFQVPQGVNLILLPTHTFSAYIEDGSAEVGTSTCRIKIEKRDSSLSDVLVVYGPDLYYSSKEFQEKSKMAHLSVSESGLIVNEREYIVISVYDDGTIDESDSYFELNIAQTRKAITG